VCIPGVPDEKSITRPVKNDRRRSNHDDISKGNNKMNIKYIYGLT
jgi:hypothetical protein